jgi:transcriptional regulator of acetoin/glycerol metabolism
MGVIGTVDLGIGRAAGAGRRPAEAVQIAAVLEKAGWNVAKAARQLGIPRPTFYRKLRRYRLVRPDIE